MQCVDVPRVMWIATELNQVPAHILEQIYMFRTWE